MVLYVAFSKKNNVETKPIAIKNSKNFYILYLAIENSSVITSIVEI